MQDIAEQDAKKVLSLLKPMRLGRRSQQIGRKPIPLIHLEDGTVAPDLQSAQDRWRRHFGRMEGGTTTTAGTLLDKQGKLPQGQHVEVDKIPSIFELELHMMKSKSKKAMGPDGVPSELLKHAPARTRIPLLATFRQVLPMQTRESAVQRRQTGGCIQAARLHTGVRQLSRFAGILITG